MIYNMITFRKHPILWFYKYILRRPVFSPENLERVELDLDKDCLKKWFNLEPMAPTTYTDKNWIVQDITVWDCWLAIRSVKHIKTKPHIS